MAHRGGQPPYGRRLIEDPRCISTNRAWALKMAQVLLEMTASEFWSRTPGELAQEFWARRRRNNLALAREAWKMEWLLAPHISRRDRSKVRAQRILWGAPGYDPDEDELMTERPSARPAAITAPRPAPRQEGLAELNAVFDKIEALRGGR